MLIDFNTGEPIDNMPHEDSYRHYRSRLSDENYRAIIDEIHRRMENVPELFNASFLPGSDWTGTVYFPIYTACGDDEEIAKLFYGQLVWEAVQLHRDRWACIRVNLIPERILGLTYFRYKGH
jgi:hypothetical protein